MITKASLAGSFVLLAASLGQAMAGPTISDQRYWPNEVGPSAYRQVGESAYAQQVPKTRRSAASKRSSRLQQRKAAPIKRVQKATYGIVAKGLFTVVHIRVTV